MSIFNSFFFRITAFTVVYGLLFKLIVPTEMIASGVGFFGILAYVLVVAMIVMSD